MSAAMELVVTASHRLMAPADDERAFAGGRDW